jgi:hypothetical protein
MVEQTAPVLSTRYGCRLASVQALLKFDNLEPGTIGDAAKTANATQA